MNIISLGAGVQSTTMLLMAMRGEIEPMPDCAIFADTGWEPKAVYKHLAWLESVSTIQIRRVSQGSIRKGTIHGNRVGHRIATMPLHVKKLDGGRGMLMRECTREFKVNPIRREIRESSDWRRETTTMWLGISLDESHRMSDSQVRYIANRYPLIEKRMTRWSCRVWLDEHGYPDPPKSACIGCPYRSNDSWNALTESEFADAVDFDRSIRRLHTVDADLFLHADLVPLDMVDRRTEQEKGQLDLWGNECEGMCGL